VSREWYRPLPPPSTPFRWSMRDNLNYTETAALVALNAAAQQSDALLRNFYLKALHSWQAGVQQAPYAFVIPADQGDPMRVAQLVIARVQHAKLVESESLEPTKRASGGMGSTGTTTKRTSKNSGRRD